MKLAVALAGIQRLYVETAPFIYFAERHIAYVLSSTLYALTVSFFRLSGVRFGLRFWRS